MVNKFKNKSIIITGGAGFIGGHLTEELINLGAKVIVIDIKVHSKSYFAQKKLAKKIKLKIINITNKKNLMLLFKRHHPDYIFHLAAKVLVEDSYKNPWETLNTNVMGTVNVLEAARTVKNLKAIIVASSDKAYGKLNKTKYLETDSLKGDHPYEVSKSAADLISYSYYKTYGLPVTVSRFGNIYGEGDLNFSRIIPDIMKTIVMKNTLKIRSNGKHVRDYIYVKDVVKGYLLLASKINITKGQAYNFGSTDTLSVLSLIRLVENSLKKKISFKIINNQINEIAFQHLDYNKAIKLGWINKHTFKDKILDMLEWYKLTLT
jgi:CDP-glucose 4,6-dehydratase